MPLSFLSPDEVARYQRADALRRLANMTHHTSRPAAVKAALERTSKDILSRMGEILQCSPTPDAIFMEIQYVRSLI